MLVGWPTWVAADVNCVMLLHRQRQEVTCFDILQILLGGTLQSGHQDCHLLHPPASHCVARHVCLTCPVLQSNNSIASIAGDLFV
jgi:hypothetical protein